MTSSVRVNCAAIRSPSMTRGVVSVHQRTLKRREVDVDA